VYTVLLPQGRKIMSERIRQVPTLPILGFKAMPAMASVSLFSKVADIL
jgi:hypothetical protein